MIATTCDESMLRMEQYVRRGGCSTFEKNKEASYPLSIWTDQDIYTYIDKFNLRLCDLYAKGFVRTGCMSCGFGAHIDKNRFGLFSRTCPRIAKKFLLMKTMVLHTKLLSGLVVFLFLLSCSTTRKAQATEKTTMKNERQTETVFVHDTTVADGQTTTYVIHDTINGKPVVITRTTTRTKTVRTGGQVKTITDTVFVHDTATKTVKGNIIPSKEKRPRNTRETAFSLLCSCCWLWLLPSLLSIMLDVSGHSSEESEKYLLIKTFCDWEKKGATCDMPRLFCLLLDLFFHGSNDISFRVLLGSGEACDTR